MKNFTKNVKRWPETLERKVIKHCGEMSVFSKLLEYICPHEVEKSPTYLCNTWLYDSKQTDLYKRNKGI